MRFYLTGSNANFLAIYNAIGIFSLLFLLGGTILVAVGATRASKFLHNELINKVIYFPMAFFDTV